jgi:hypothetical protein
MRKLNDVAIVSFPENQSVRQGGKCRFRQRADFAPVSGPFGRVVEQPEGRLLCANSPLCCPSCRGSTRQAKLFCGFCSPLLAQMALGDTTVGSRPNPHARHRPASEGPGRDGDAADLGSDDNPAVRTSSPGTGSTGCRQVTEVYLRRSILWVSLSKSSIKIAAKGNGDRHTS